MARIFVTPSIPEDLHPLLRQHFEVRFWNDSSSAPQSVLVEELQKCSGLLTNLNDKISQAILEQAGSELRVISNLAVGYNNIDVAAAAAKGIAVCNTPGVLTDATANTALALLLAVTRRIVEGDSTIRQQQWSGWSATDFIGFDLTPQTVVGVLGFGRIGQAFARKCFTAFGCQIRYHSRTRKADAETASQATFCSSLDELLASSDVLSVHLDLNSGTTGLLNSARLEKIKRGAILINTARGEIVDEAALYLALSEGKLWGAGLDVFSPEPPAADNPLLTLRNVVLTPHLGSATKQTRRAMAQLAIENLIAGLTTNAVPNCVNSENLKR